MFKNTRKINEYGITLIALVVTIIVLLILAGVTITIAINNDGLINKAKISKESSIVASEKDQVQIAYSSALASTMGDTIDEEILQMELDTAVGREKTLVTPCDEGEFYVYYYDTNHNYITNGETIELIELTELHIANYNDLLNFANGVNGGNSYRNYIVYLDNDITITDDEWVIIGYYGGRDDPSMSFEGVFDGKNHTISGIKSRSDKTYSGLFYSNYGTIKNLNVETTITSNGYSGCGGISSNNSGLIKNCNVSINANINSMTDNRSPSLGGIAGNNGGTINDCTVRGTIIGRGNYLYVGGIAGNNWGTITNCKNEAFINSCGSYRTGGIVAENSGEILKCINLGMLQVNRGDIGGICGMQTYLGGTVDECVNKGNINLDSVGSNTYAVGGICGRNKECTLSNCYNTGSIYFTSNIGGTGTICGIVNSSEDTGTIRNCYTTGEISLSNYSFGKAAFYRNSSAVANCYYNSDTCNASDDVATAKTTSQMKNASFISELGGSFKADTNNINNGFPILNWQ